MMYIKNKKEMGMNALELYNYLKNNLNNLARLYNINNLDDYYSQTDLRNNHILSLNGMSRVFTQFVLHTQNATMISGIVNFDKNYDFIRGVLMNFNPNDIITFYGIHTDGNGNNEASKRMVDTFRQGLHWDTTKSKNPDSIITRFSNSIIDGAIYFSEFSRKEDLVDDLISHYSMNNHRELVSYLLTKIKHGFSVALCCDFLKELDTRFDLPKPDVHLMDVISKYKGYDKSYYKKSSERAFECIDDIIQIVNEIKSSENSEDNLTVYKFDRIVWLCCTGNFFITNDGSNLKDNLLNGIN